MKNVLTIISAVLLSLSVLAQGDGHPLKSKNTRSKACPKVYLGTSTGINNFCGITGITLDVPVSDAVSVEGGVGISTWGTKVGIGGKYYFGQCHTGWAVGAGLTHNSGLSTYDGNMSTIYGTEEVQLDLRPQTNMYIAGYRFWGVGKRGNRLFMMAGYSVRLTSELYSETYGYPITSVAERALSIIAPGGLIFGGGFAFGLGR